MMSTVCFILVVAESPEHNLAERVSQVEKNAPARHVMVDLPNRNRLAKAIAAMVLHVGCHPLIIEKKEEPVAFPFHLVRQIEFCDWLDRFIGPPPGNKDLYPELRKGRKVKPFWPELRKRGQRRNTSHGIKCRGNIFSHK